MIPEIEQKRADLEALCRRHHVRRLELFRSAATGEIRAEDSELDLLVEFEPLPLAFGGIFSRRDPRQSVMSVR